MNLAKNSESFIKDTLLTVCDNIKDKISAIYSRNPVLEAERQEISGLVDRSFLRQ
jgi:hypothetical protein